MSEFPGSKHGFADAPLWEAGGKCSARTKREIPRGRHWWLDTIADNQMVAQRRALESLKQKTNLGQAHLVMEAARVLVRSTSQRQRCYCT